MRQVFSLLLAVLFLVVCVFVIKTIVTGIQEMKDFGGYPLQWGDGAPPIIYIEDADDEEEQAVLDLAVERGGWDAQAIQRELDEAGLAYRAVADRHGDLYVSKR